MLHLAFRVPNEMYENKFLWHAKLRQILNVIKSLDFLTSKTHLQNNSLQLTSNHFLKSQFITK